MLQTLYSKSLGTVMLKQQNIALQIPVPDSENGLNSSQITTDSFSKKN